MSILFGVTCCYLGFGSGLFHASLTGWGQQLDVAAMYSPLTVFIAINVGRWISCLKTEGREGSFPTWPILVGLVLVASFLLYQVQMVCAFRRGHAKPNPGRGLFCFTGPISASPQTVHSVAALVQDRLGFGARLLATGRGRKIQRP